MSETSKRVLCALDYYLHGPAEHITVAVLAREVKALEDALRPFAEAADTMLGEHNASDSSFAELFIEGGPTVADFLVAAAVLKGKT